MFHDYETCILMTNMKRWHLLTLLLTFTLLSFSLTGVDAQSISGDDVCGGTAATSCKFTDLGKVVKGALALTVILGLPLLVCFVAYRFIVAWFAREQGASAMYQDALKKSANAVFGFFLLVVLVGGGFLVFLKFFGVQSSDGNNPLKILELFSRIDLGLIPHAYAQTGGTGNSERLLPNFLSAESIYDLLLNMVRLFMRFFVYPALIIIWVWTGFAFVQAQGSPDGINKAKKWLWRAFVTTVVIFMIQAFLVAIRGTVEQVLPGTTTQRSGGNVFTLIEVGKKAL